jgi:hypothetical protein
MKNPKFQKTVFIGYIQPSIQFLEGMSTVYGVAETKAVFLNEWPFYPNLLQNQQMGPNGSAYNSKLDSKEWIP